VSCSNREGKNIPLYTVARSTFENALVIDGYVEPVQATTATCPPHISGTIEFLVDDGTFVKEGDVVCRVEVAEIQTQYDQVKTNMENAEVELTKTQANLAMQYALLEAQVKNNEAETQIAALDSLQIQYLSPNQVRIKELELEQIRIQKARYEKKLQALIVIQQSEIRQRQLQYSQLANRLQSMQERMNALTVKAPKDGLAIRATNPATGKKLQVGDPVWHLMPLVKIPEFSRMKVMIRASETDFKYINLNDSVSYSFDAMPNNFAFGKITMKSPVGQQYKEGSKVKFFEMEASIDSTLEMPDPGFTAACRIMLKLVRDTLVVPQIAVFEEDSLKVVYVKNSKGYEAQAVTLGVSSAKEAVIASGLKGGEKIAMIKPEASLIRKKQ
jgi:multidrug resistance efflux pump